MSAKSRSDCLPAPSARPLRHHGRAEYIEWGRPGSGLGPPARVLETTHRPTLLKTCRSPSDGLPLVAQVESRGSLLFTPRRVSTPAGGSTKTPRVWERLKYMLPFRRKSRVYNPKLRIAHPGMSRGSDGQRPGYRPMRVLHATVPSSSGPARKHMAKFETAVRSWAQMTSGFGPPPTKRILSRYKHSYSNFKGQIEYQDLRARI